MEQYPWLQGLTDEQCWKIWLACDRLRGYEGFDPCPFPDPITGEDVYRLVTTPAQAADLIGFIYDTHRMARVQMEELEDLECELERDDEFALAKWVRKLRYSRESEDEEQKRYDRYDELVEQLVRRRQHRKPRS